MKRPTDGALTRRSRRKVGANILLHPESVRKRQHPNALRLEAFETITHELRRIQRRDQNSGVLSPVIILALQFADVIDSWERIP